MTKEEINQKLFHSCVVGNLETAKEAIEAGADVEYISEQYPSIPLDAAVLFSRDKIVDLLLSHNASVSDICLSTAIYQRDPKKVKALLLGNLKDVSWELVFMSLLYEMKLDPDEKSLHRISALLDNYLNSCIQIATKFVKAMENCCVVDEGDD